MSHGKRRLEAFLGILCVFTGTAAAPAQAEETGARAQGQGATGVADSTDVGVFPANFAAAALVEQYQVVTGGIAGPDHTWGLRAGAMDSRTSKITLGATFRRTWDNTPPTGVDLPGWWPVGQDWDNPAVHQGVQVAGALPFLERRLSAGAVLRYDWRSSEIAGASSAFNMGVGVAGVPVKTFTLAATATNLLENNYADTERTLSLGAAWAPGTYLQLQLGADAPLDKDFAWSRMAWKAGGSIGVAEAFHLNLGYFDEAAAGQATAGLTISSPQADLDYGVRLAVADPKRTFHALDLRLKF